MAITVSANPVVLRWQHFRSVGTLIDPADGQAMDAYTSFNYNIPATPQSSGRHQTVADPLVITITPNCKVRTGATRTAALLSHEQFHYDVGIVTARALARQLSHLRANTVAALATQLRAAVRLHFTTRAGLLQRRYDKDTHHGTNAHYQGIWKNRMRTCLGNSRADQLGGYYL